MHEYRAAGLNQSNLPHRSDRSDEQRAWYRNNVPQGFTLGAGWTEAVLSSAEPICQLCQVFKHELAGTSILDALHEEITAQNAESHYCYYLHFPDQLTAPTLYRIYSFLEATVPDADKRLVNALFSEYQRAKDANSENTELLDLLLVKLFQALPDQIQSRVAVIEGLSDHINLRLNPEKQKEQISYPPIQRPNAPALNKSPQLSVS